MSRSPTIAVALLLAGLILPFVRGADRAGANAAAIASNTSASPAPAGPQVRRGKFVVTEADRAWWSFQPVRRPPLPRVLETSRVSNPIDAFLLARLEARGLTFNPPASRRELIRRAYFDLIGLPPAPEDVEAFARDRSPEAWPALVDRLLSQPQYGERWGRHWLDLVRYAESNGYDR